MMPTTRSAALTQLLSALRDYDEAQHAFGRTCVIDPSSPETLAMWATRKAARDRLIAQFEWAAGALDLWQLDDHEIRSNPVACG